MSDYDDIDVLIDNDPIALGQRCREAEAEVARLKAECDSFERRWGEAYRRAARHEETLRWVKVIWAGKSVPEFIPGYVQGRLDEVRP